MELHNLKPAPGSTKKTKRIGRGQGSGHGGTSTRGHKGDRARSGSKQKIGFEGGQMPLQRRIPKFGFNNINRVEYVGINLDALQMLVDTYQVSFIDLAVLRQHGLAHSKKPVKILGRGELKSKINVKANAFSASAKSAIETLGGTVETF